MKFQAGIASSQAKAPKSFQTIPLTKITNHSLSTATTVMIRHLFDTHNISLSSGKGSAISDQHFQQKLSLAGSRSRQSVTSGSTLNEDLLMWLAMDNLLFSTVDTRAFHAVFVHQLPKITLPSSDTVRLTTLPKVYTSTKTKVTDLLLSVPTLCLMFDGWSDEHNAQHFLGIRASVIADNWSSMVVTLSCKQCPQDVPGINGHIAAELSDLGLTPDILKDKLVGDRFARC